MKTIAMTVVGLLAAACSTGERASDLQYDPTVRAALVQSQTCHYWFSFPPALLDDAAGSPESPRYKPPNLEGTWQLSECYLTDPSGNPPAVCDQLLTLSHEGDGHIITADGLAWLSGGVLRNADPSTSSYAFILQRTHVTNGSCVEDHIWQLFVNNDSTDASCADYCVNHVHIFDVVVGSSCQSIGSWTCSVGTMTKAP